MTSNLHKCGHVLAHIHAPMHININVLISFTHTHTHTHTHTYAALAALVNSVVCGSFVDSVSQRETGNAGGVF